MAESNGKLEILFKTDKYIIINKPVGKDSEKDVPTLLNENGIEAKVFHRLDREVGGVMLLTISDDAPQKLTATSFEKEYLAVVCGKPTGENGTYRDLLYHDRGKNKTFVVKKKRAGVKEAELNYSVIKTAIIDGKERTLVSVRLVTGRTHQIRVQFASRKTPIVSDAKYGGEKDANYKTMLFSHSLCFTDPFTNEKISVEKNPEWLKLFD